MTTSVHELDLPEVDLIGLDRADALAVFAAAQREHWLARTPLGYVVTRYDDVHSLLRERRFHSALSMIADTAGAEGRVVRERNTSSILSMEGDEHTRLRRLVSPAFTPRATD